MPMAMCMYSKTVDFIIGECTSRTARSAQLRILPATLTSCEGLLRRHCDSLDSTEYTQQRRVPAAIRGVCHVSGTCLHVI